MSKSVFRAINSTLIYVERGDEYLMLHRTKKKNDANHDKWLGVGGGIEENETPEQCLLREVFEETGLTLTAWQKRGVIDFVSDCWEDEQMHLYTADAWTGECIECNEGDLEWLPFDRIPSLPLWEGDRIFLNLLRENAPYFTLRLEYAGEKLSGAILNGKELAI